MYEIAQVAGNKFEAACAIKSLTNIMGQITSNQSPYTIQNGQSKRKSGFNQNRHSSVQPRLKEDSIYRDHLKDQLLRVKDGSNSKKSPINGLKISERPVTISEMNAYNIEKNELAAHKELHQQQKQIKTKDFYSCGEGYHKTDGCYIKTPDGGYHKLPPDSYHKMSEGCYAKMQDGSFRKLDDINSQNDTSGGHVRVKSNVMRFLKRSKSHTPATIKDMQKEKDKVVAGTTAATGSRMPQVPEASGQNRRVMVNMLDGGGLPIVATSKRAADSKSSSSKSKDKDGKSSHRKVNIFFIFVNVISQ